MVINNQKTFLSGIFEAFSFTTLLILPFLLVWLIVSAHQNKTDATKKESAKEEMTEVTAHLFRLANPQTYLQNELYNLSKKTFKWSSMPTNEVDPPNLNIPISYYLFDENDKRIPWPDGNNSMQSISEKYLTLIKKLNSNQNLTLDKKELITSKMFTGSSSTPQILISSPDTLLNLQNIGLQKYCGFYRTEFNDGSQGTLLVIVNIRDINIERLASNAIYFMKQRLSPLSDQDTYHFCWLNLNNPNKKLDTTDKEFTKNELLVLTENNMVSDFEYEGNMYSTIDTSDRIRLVCKRRLPNSTDYTNTYFSILICIIPTFLLLYLWKIIFNVKIQIFAGTSFIFFVVYMVLLGITLIIASTTIYNQEWQKYIIEEHKQKAENIIAKVDKNYSMSFSDLKKQYRHFVKQLSEPNANIQEILSPLEIPQKNNDIIFAGYINSKNEYEFMVPKIKDGNKNYASRFYAIIPPFNEQILSLYNSSKRDSNYGNSLRQSALQVVSGRPVNALLLNRSEFRNLKFADKESLCFFDLMINDKEIAEYGLYIIHDATKLQLKYLGQSKQSILAETGFSLVAFPKNSLNQAAYFTSYSLHNEEPLWKLNDLVNKTKITNFKTGTIDGIKCLIACSPGYKLKDYNLFLIMPLNKIAASSKKLSFLYLSAISITILFIIIMSFKLAQTVFVPISLIRKRLNSLKSNDKTDLFPNVSEGQLASLTSDLVEFAVKCKELTGNDISENHLIPTAPLILDTYEISGFRVSNGNPNKEFFTYSTLDGSNSYAYMMRTNQNDSAASYMPSVCKTAIKLLFEDLNIHSSAQCVKDLNEFVKINLHKTCDFDSILINISQDENKAYYSGTGKYSIYKINKDKEIELINPQFQNDAEQANNSLSNDTIDNISNSTIVIVSEYLENNMDIKNIIKRNVNKDNLCDILKNRCIQELKLNAKQSNDAGCAIVIKFAELNKND